MLPVADESLFNHFVLHNVFSPTWSVLFLVNKSIHLVKAKKCNMCAAYRRKEGNKNISVITLFNLIIVGLGYAFFH